MNVRVHRGDHVEAVTLLEAMSGRRNYEVPWIDSVIAHQLALSGRTAEARARLDALAQYGFARVCQQHELSTLGCYYLLAELCVELGDAARAVELYERMLPFEDMMAAPFLAVVWHGSMAHALGVLATFLRRWDDAERHFDRALQIAAQLSSPPLTAISSESFGAALLRRSRAGQYTERGVQFVARACKESLSAPVCGTSRGDAPTCSARGGPAPAAGGGPKTVTTPGDPPVRRNGTAALERRRPPPPLGRGEISATAAADFQPLRVSGRTILRVASLSRAVGCEPSPSDPSS